VRFTPDGRYLLSAGGAPQNKGFLAVWNAADGKLLSGDELAVGTLFALALSADGKLVGLGTGGTARPGGPEMNNGLILKLPPAAKMGGRSRPLRESLGGGPLGVGPACRAGPTPRAARTASPSPVYARS
jgi:hypothetical protein